MESSRKWGVTQLKPGLSAALQVLFTLLAERYERGSVLIPAILPFSKWEGILKDL